MLHIQIYLVDFNRVEENVVYVLPLAYIETESVFFIIIFNAKYPKF